MQDSVRGYLRATGIAKVLRSKNWCISLSTSVLGGKVSSSSEISTLFTWPDKKLDPSTRFEKVRGISESVGSS